MTDYFRRCEDGHRCENGSFCKENPNQEGSFYCDCSTAIGGKFAGLYCEYEAQSKCKSASDVEASWFCVNQGECASVDSLWTCKCNNNFEGPHCEFINGAVPDDWPIAMRTNSNLMTKAPQEGMGDGVLAGRLVGILIVLVVLGYAFYKKRNGEDLIPNGLFSKEGSKGQNAPRDQSEALAIEADGDVLRESVKAMSADKVDNQGFPILDSTPESETANGSGVSGHLL